MVMSTMGDAAVTGINAQVNCLVVVFIVTVVLCILNANKVVGCARVVWMKAVRVEGCV